MTANATPRPWRTDTEQRDPLAICADDRPGELPWLIANVHRSEGCEANAALIVRAVNERDGLLAALKNIDVEILEAVANEITEFKHSARMGSVRIIAKQIRAAIARAEESGE